MLPVATSIPEPVKELLQAQKGTVTGEQILAAFDTKNPVPKLYEGFLHGHIEKILGASDPTRTSAAQLSELFDWALKGFKSSLVSQDSSGERGFYSVAQLAITKIHLRNLNYQSSTTEDSFANLSAPTTNV